MEYTNEMNEILNYIDKYNNGDIYYLDDMFTIIDSIKEYIKTGKKIALNLQFKSFNIKIKFFLYNLIYMEHINYKFYINKYNNDLKIYKNYLNLLKKYIVYVKKTENFTNLKQAFTLTSELSSILEYMNNYIYDMINDFTQQVNYSNTNYSSNSVFLAKQNLLKIEEKINTLKY